MKAHTSTRRIRRIDHRQQLLGIRAELGRLKDRLDLVEKQQQ